MFPLKLYIKPNIIYYLCYIYLPPGKNVIYSVHCLSLLSYSHYLNMHLPIPLQLLTGSALCLVEGSQSLTSLQSQL
jgi:hypothetical protein